MAVFIVFIFIVFVGNKVIELRDLSSAFSETPFCEPSTGPLVPTIDEYRTTSYKVEGIRESACARILFTVHEQTDERIVMKLLLEYKDTRYSLETVEKRQQCQLEALERNRVFSPEVYIGLASVDKTVFEQASVGDIIHIDEVLEQPSRQNLELGTEYVLLMKELPKDSRLDVLLGTLDENTLQEHLLRLTRFIATGHLQLASSPLVQEEEQRGSYEQLQAKLLHNIELLDLVVAMNKKLNYDGSGQMEDMINWLKDNLSDLLTTIPYEYYFKQRVSERRIKLCHGDLKAPHIWIMRDNVELHREFIVVDAIDFNPMYSIIDSLSDFAMLVIDIQGRLSLSLSPEKTTESSIFSDQMIECYLQLTAQESERDRTVLYYYLVEKAIVSAGITLLYEDISDHQLGMSFLKVAIIRLKRLLKMQHSSMATPQALLAAGSPVLV
jgi:aminoglycoside phosphotransferase family enzyme